GTSGSSTAYPACPGRTRSDGDARSPGGGRRRFSSVLLPVDRTRSERETGPYRKVTVLADQAVGDEGVQHRQQPPAASLLVQDVADRDSPGGGVRLRGAQDVDDLGRDVAGAGLADTGASGDQLIECEAMERLLAGRGSGDQSLPRCEDPVGDQLQQFAAGSVGATAVLDQLVHVG